MARITASDVRRGQIYLVKLDPTIGSEIQKTRPALITQNDVGNKYSPVTIVAPITSKPARKRYPTEVWISPQESGLKVNARVLLNQVRTIDKSRLVRIIGELTSRKMEEVDLAIRISLGL